MITNINGANLRTPVCIILDGRLHVFQRLFRRKLLLKTAGSRWAALNYYASWSTSRQKRDSEISGKFVCAEACMHVLVYVSGQLLCFICVCVFMCVCVHWAEEVKHTYIRTHIHAYMGTHDCNNAFAALISRAFTVKVPSHSSSVSMTPTHCFFAHVCVYVWVYSRCISAYFQSIHSQSTIA